MKRNFTQLKVFLQALKVSVKLKSAMSMFISIIGFAAALVPAAISMMMSAFAEEVQRLVTDKGSLHAALTSFGLITLLYVIQALFTLGQNYYADQDSIRIRRYVKEQLIQVASEVKYRYIENYDGFIEKVEFVKQYAGQKAAGSMSLIFGWISSLISFISIIIILGEINWWIVLILIVTCIPAIILANLQKDEDYRQRTKWMKEGAITIHYSDTLRMNEPMKDIRFFGIYEFLKKKWRHFADIYIKAKKAITRKHVLHNSIADLLRNGVYFFVLIITAHEIYNDPTKGLGAFMLVITAASQLQNITTRLLTDAVSIFSDIKYMKDFFDLLEMEKEEKEAELPFDHFHISFENVDFQYPNSNDYALKGVSVEIKQGEKIAIVGANGSGKSTFVNLICGLYEPKNGSIKVNGEDIRENLPRVRRSLSVVFQTFSHYHDTLRSNITISSPDRSNEDCEIMELAQKTGIDQVIHEMSNGLDEMIGVFSTNGTDLSGGQWQKVAITRALYRKDACVYILDEPTAALDPISEANLYRNFSEITGQKTTLLISHRLGIASVVNRILVFDKGKIVEDGSHDELMKINGVYAKLYEAQAKWYQDI